MSQEKFEKSGKQSPAQRIRDARERRGLTQAALAAQLGVARPMIAQWETGTRNPWISTLKRLATALDVSYEWLAFGEERTMPHEETPSLDPALFTAVQSVVTEVFEERGLDVGKLFFYMVVATVYAVAHRLQMEHPAPTTSSFKENLRESILRVLSLSA